MLFMFSEVTFQNQRVSRSAFITNLFHYSLSEQCPNTVLFLVRIFLYSVRMQENTEKKETLAQVFSCEICEISNFEISPLLTEHLQWLLLRAPNFVSVSRLCTIQNTSNSLAKAHVRTPFVQNSSQWLLSNFSYYFKKGKNRHNFSYLL